MISKSRFIVGLSIFVIYSFSALATATELSCRAEKNGVHYSAKVVMSEGKFDSFFYGSMTKNGQTCEVVGAQNEKESTWLDEQKNGALVSLFFENEEIAKVSLLHTDTTATIKIESPLTKICGVSGYIAKTVVISANNKTCSLRD